MLNCLKYNNLFFLNILQKHSKYKNWVLSEMNWYVKYQIFFFLGNLKTALKSLKEIAGRNEFITKILFTSKLDNRLLNI